MADAYGMITFKKSEDCLVDIHGLKDILNQFEWDNSGAKWACSDSGSLYIEEYFFHQPQFPTAIPKEVAFYQMFDKVIDGYPTFYQKVPELMTEADWNVMAGDVDRPIPLQKLSELICPFLKLGWIEISCVANEKARYVYFEQLRIHSDSRAYSKRNCSGPCVETEEVEAEYCPNAES